MAKANPRYSNGNARRKLRAYWRDQGLPCALCHRPIDYALPARDPMSFEVDEIVPVSLGGDPYSIGNTQPVHRACNLRKSNRVVCSVDPPPAEGDAAGEGADEPALDW